MADINASVSERPKKRRASQIPFGIGLLVGIIGVAFFIGNHQPKSALLWILGVVAGFVLQRSRFCFTASLRDPMLTGGTSLTKAVIIAIAIATVGFSSYQFHSISKGALLPGNIDPVGIHTIVGAILFGIGMVVASGCASGTLMRVGEGSVMQMISLIFFLIGSLWGAKDFGWWSVNFIPKKGIFLPEILGWPLALTLQFIMLLILYILADWFGNRKPNG